MDVRCSNCGKWLNGRPRCAFCGTEGPKFPTSQRAIEAQSRNSVLKWLAILAGSWFVFCLVVLIIAVEVQPNAPDAFNSMSPAAHLSAAKAELKPDSAQDKIEDALHHLDAIPKSSPEATEAASLRRDFLLLQEQRTQERERSALSQAEKAIAAGNSDEAANLLIEAKKIANPDRPTQFRLAALQRRIDSANAQKEKEATAQQKVLQKTLREQWAKNSQEELWREGYEIKFRAQGTTLYVDYILAGDAFAFQFNEKVIQPNSGMLKQLGFTRVVLNNGDMLRIWQLN